MYNNDAFNQNFKQQFFQLGGIQNITVILLYQLVKTFCNGKQIMHIQLFLIQLNKINILYFKQRFDTHYFIEMRVYLITYW